MAEGTSSLKTRSHASCSSVQSSASSTGSAAAKARAKAEAAKARLVFVEKEVALKLEKAKLEASITKLNYEKETAAAIAEAEALEAAVDLNSDKQSSKLSMDFAPLDTPARTEQYVLNQNQIQETHRQSCAGSDPAAESKPDFNISSSQLKADATSFLPTAFQCPQVAPRNPSVSKSDGPGDVMLGHDSGLNTQYYRAPNINPFYPHPAYTNNRSSNMNDFVRYLARRELVATGLLQFNDKPQNYRAWKRSFKSATLALDLSPSEEMDLLLKWLGRESVQHVEQIRAIHINHPQAGLNMIWKRLDEKYGSAEAIEDALFKHIEDFPKITNRDYSKLTKLGDLLMELLSAKSKGDLPGLSFLDTARGVNPIVLKLPYRLQERWATVGASYKQQKCVQYPPFSYFVDFVCQEARIASDPSFNFVSHTDTAQINRAPPKSNKFKEVYVHKTEISPQGYRDADTTLKPNECDKMCPIHRKPHPLYKCRAFKEKSINDRMALLRENNICFRCCLSSTHIARNCRVKLLCAECKSEEHHTALHPDPRSYVDPQPQHGGEDEITTSQPQVNSKCTEICGGEQTNRSCSKICLVKVYPAGCRDKAVKLYAILDEQSNRSLVRSQFFDVFNDRSPSAPYTLRTCAGVREAAGRRASGYEIESLDGNVRILLPSLIECNDIPNNRDEIPTPEVARHHQHLKSLAHLIPNIDPQAQIMLLLCRDLIRVHKVRKQLNGPHDLPYAQKLDLGWVIIGNICLGSNHMPQTINTFYTKTTETTRPTLFEPCPNVFCIKEKYSSEYIPTHPSLFAEMDPECCADHLGCAVFRQTKEDNQLAPSIQDALFMKTMNEGLHKDANNSWVAPLPFKHPRQRLPNNKPQALKRLISLKQSFRRKPEMREHFLSFMEKMFVKGHAEIAPPVTADEEQWYLAIFGVYHPKKPNQIRVVFDSSAQYEGVALNDVLLTGPDLNNSLLGVLLRFRKEAVAFTADIEQMFYCFYVREEDRNFLCFLWFQDNDPSKNIIDYRMNVHVFGNRPSPAVAIHGLHQSVQDQKFKVDADFKNFVTRDFYVDDGLKSLPTVEAAVKLLKRT
ncbi:PREDICTED: uncharacterized protein LOC107084717 isoform X2 [Cyprinodon variegatus]|uniref:uncharacterized protein LOC107084717 isoform X1 n=1 Tax=Cyprinodon variegatus TaxID=28743 RepID=UPI0007428411|nr:PREDICTED: uncharacterized protein LOC107084717 isoform X1 [Cyprinodon variegatus]XP_015230162.1 PREDICTED: uncharacterized protein LOC107084717 isoform X2 [Cyprinodon variegatus]